MAPVTFHTFWARLVIVRCGQRAFDKACPELKFSRRANTEITWARHAMLNREKRLRDELAFTVHSVRKQRSTKEIALEHKKA